MASPCEVLVDTDDEPTARAALDAARGEALRIEHKFSRYRSDNVIDRINHSAGKPVEVDEELAGLLDYAATCTEAGTLATLAILRGGDAARFLEEQGVQHWLLE